jgi:hypothetical protein
VIGDIVGGDEGRAHLGREVGQLAQPSAFVAAIGEGGTEMDAAPRGRGQGAELLGELRREISWWQHDEDLPFAGGQHLLEAKMTLAFDGVEVAGRQQAAQASVSGAVDRIAGRLEAVGGDEACAHAQADIMLLRGSVGPHHAGQRIAVGDADRGKTQRGSLSDHLVRMRGPAQEREVGGGDQLGEGGHGRLHSRR